MDPASLIERAKERCSLQITIYVSLVAALLVIFVGLILIGTTTTDDRALTVSSVMLHLEALQTIGNNSNRVDGSANFFATLNYVRERLASKASMFDVSYQPFFYAGFDGSGVNASLMSSDGLELSTAAANIQPFSYSGNTDGLLSGLSAVAVAAYGCAAIDFPPLAPGKALAVIKRGNCTFALKAANAVSAGAAAVIIWDPLNPTFLAGTARPDSLDADLWPIPVLGVPQPAGSALYASSPSATFSVEVSGCLRVLTNSSNLVAVSKEGNADAQIVVGAHADSVAAGPGINDDGSGTSVLLAIAEYLHETGYAPVNQLVFAWWGAEEEGLIGSTEYVRTLSSQALANTAAMLDFDMLGSPNWNRGLYDGSTTPVEEARAGSAAITHMFAERYASQQLFYTLLPFDGRSDYQAFITAGIPAGGICTGAEQLKTTAERSQPTVGGLAHAPYDPCYHLDCDTIENVNLQILAENTETALHSIRTLADDSKVRTTLGSRVRRELRHVHSELGALRARALSAKKSSHAY